MEKMQLRTVLTDIRTVEVCEHPPFVVCPEDRRVHSADVGHQYLVQRPFQRELGAPVQPDGPGLRALRTHVELTVRFEDERIGEMKVFVERGSERLVPVGSYLVRRDCRLLLREGIVLDVTYMPPVPIHDERICEETVRGIPDDLRAPEHRVLPIADELVGDSPSRLSADQLAGGFLAQV